MSEISSKAQGLLPGSNDCGQNSFPCGCKTEALSSQRLLLSMDSSQHRCLFLFLDQQNNPSNASWCFVFLFVVFFNGSPDWVRRTWDNLPVD